MLYEIYGEQKSEKVLVTIPALGERKEIYKELAKVLKDYKVISFDLPGHNFHISDDNSIGIYLKTIIRTLEELKIDSAHFIGNSIGGWIIQEMYKVYPKKVSSLILLDGGFYFLGDREDMKDTITLPVIEKLEELNEAIDHTVFNMKRLKEDTYVTIKNYLFGHFTYQNKRFIHHCNEEALNQLNKEVLLTNHCLPKDIDIPVGLVVAKNNLDHFSSQKLNTYKDLHPLTIVNVIQNGYHLLPITNTNEVADFIKSFLSRSNWC